jgi:hypothetical protein
MGGSVVVRLTGPAIALRRTAYQQDEYTDYGYISQGISQAAKFVWTKTQKTQIPYYNEPEYLILRKKAE